MLQKIFSSICLLLFSANLSAVKIPWKLVQRNSGCSLFVRLPKVFIQFRQLDELLDASACNI